ncbi:3-dehydroquinate synthase [Pullulanibacillus pueri]|uniref:3-dehydroquinate synthase n=1 Tax=Pullulanibacillus pueri TaxID=1437324 RepID=A0A8J3ELL0_9BACL|nr:3-dehydroquinate synthase [Pullulanibacillus pueri]MBM7681461.1 3-dehydroquinate synthase [Pullulanibacillus pueri]GGH78970.1 3-dehydroquinate synthase [Pullulanibacillus pueri]
MEQFTITTPHKTYPVVIGKGLRHQLLELLKKEFSAYVIVTDSQIAPLYLEDVKKALMSKPKVYSYVVPSGEASKDFDTYKRLIDYMVELNLDRQCCVIALGGGVVGDLAGFVAASFLRGVAFVQMPTTLLAHDSSLGGKVGINHDLGKNLIGAFYHPEAVIYDTETLSSLPEKEWRSGLAEVVKHGIIDSKALYDKMRQLLPERQAISVEVMASILKEAMMVKANIVAQDETESGVRKFLNFGHTLGHALEKESGYGALTHGEGVAIGMIFALKLSERVYHHSLPIEEITDWLGRLGLPTSIPKGLDKAKLVQTMKYDKKRTDGQIVFVLLKAIGEPKTQAVPEDLIIEVLEDFHE